VLRLHTDRNYCQRLPVEVCGDILHGFKPLLSSSVRMAFEGSSTGRGRKPIWLAAASDVRLTGYSHEGTDTLLEVQLPRLGEAAAELYEQGEFWPTKPPPEGTAVDVLAAAVDEVASRNPESGHYDHALLDRLTRLGKVLSDRLDSISLIQTARGVVPLNRAVVESARELIQRTPQPQPVRVVGKLDMVRHSTRSFALKLEDGSEVHGVLEDHQHTDALREWFGQRVLILGKAVYRPSGSLLRLDAHSLESGEGQPALFSKVPPPRRGAPPRPRPVPAGQGWKAFSAYFGQWPGTETDEEWAAILEEIRR